MKNTENRQISIKDSMSILCEKMMSLSMKNDFMTNQIYFIYFTDERIFNRKIYKADF